MDVREFVAAHAEEFSAALREWLEIPSVSAGPARHGDVQPAEIADGWDTGPFQPAERDGKVIGRGASDDKGQVLFHALGPRACLAASGTADLADILAAPLVFVAVGLDADQIHAPNEYVDLSRLLKGAESAAYLWGELAAVTR